MKSAWKSHFHGDPLGLLNLESLQPFFSADLRKKRLRRKLADLVDSLDDHKAFYTNFKSVLKSLNPSQKRGLTFSIAHIHYRGLYRPFDFIILSLCQCKTCLDNWYLGSYAKKLKNIFALYFNMSDCRRLQRQVTVGIIPQKVNRFFDKNDP